MTIQQIVTLNSQGNTLEILAQPVLAAEFGSTEFNEIVEHLRDTMNASKATGIAAPQIGINKQIIAFGGKSSLNFPDFNVPFTILVNPDYRAIGKDQVTLWEHCLSLPAKRGHTVRHAHIAYRGYDITGKEIAGQAEGILAVLLQHEIDHLKGILFPRCVPNPEDYGDIVFFEKTRGARHHIEDGLQIVKHDPQSL